MHNITKITSSLMLQGSVIIMGIGLIPLFFKDKPFLSNTESIIYTFCVFAGFTLGVFAFRGAVLKDVSK